MINARDLGFVRESREIAAENTARLSQRFTDEVYFPAGEYSFAGTAQLPARSGLPPIRGVGRTGAPRPSGDTATEGDITRWTQLDGVSAIVQFNGDGCSLSGLELRSRPWYGGEKGKFCATGPLDGSRAAAGIIVNKLPGGPPTGSLSFTDLCFTDFGSAILTMGGDNCDNSIVDGCLFMNCSACFDSRNPQSVKWKFRDNDVRFWGGAGLKTMIFADMVRGGDLTIDGLSLNHPQATLFRVQDYSPNTSVLTARDVRWDQVPNPGNYFTGFEYAGDSDVKELWYKRWLVNISATANNCDGDPKEIAMPTITKYKVPRGLPTDGIKVEVVRGAK